MVGNTSTNNFENEILSIIAILIYYEHQIKKD